jgi:hypothetical protein
MYLKLKVAILVDNWLVRLNTFLEWIGVPVTCNERRKPEGPPLIIQTQ